MNDVHTILVRFRRKRRYESKKSGSTVSSTCDQRTHSTFRVFFCTQNVEWPSQSLLPFKICEYITHNDNRKKETIRVSSGKKTIKKHARFIHIPKTKILWSCENCRYLCACT